MEPFPDINVCYQPNNSSSLAREYGFSGSPVTRFATGEPEVSRYGVTLKGIVAEKSLVAKWIIKLKPV